MKSDRTPTSGEMLTQLGKKFDHEALQQMISARAAAAPTVWRMEHVANLWCEHCKSGSVIFNPESDVVITEEILAETGARMVRDRRPGSRARSSNVFLGSVSETCFALLYYGDLRMVRTDRVAGRVDFPMIEVKSSRNPELKAGHMMSEVAVAERVSAIVFVSAVISVAQGDDVQPGMICRFFGWDWRPFFLTSGRASLRRYRNEHATIQMAKELSQPIRLLRRELDSFHKAFLRREGRRYIDNEPPPQWLYDFACERLGIWPQTSLFEEDRAELWS